MDDTPDIAQIFARKFLEHCKSKFGWSDLSKDVVMDVGCGEDGYCGKSLYKKFPDVRAIIFTDKEPIIARTFRSSSEGQYEVDVLDIEDRATIKRYEGRMTKVLSTSVFHQLKDQEEGFRNVFRLLKPGGEAAVSFLIKSLLYSWLVEMLKNPKWKGFYKSDSIEVIYENEYGTAYYKEMVEKIGFQVVECLEENQVIPGDSDEGCKVALYQMCGNYFNVSPELLEEFKEESFQVLMKVSPRDRQGRACYRSTTLSLLLVKPTEVPGSH